MEITSVSALAGTESVKSPFASVIVPIVEFLTMTEAPTTPALFSSTTLPVIVLFCAQEMADRKRNKGSSSPLQIFFIRKF